MSSPRFCQVPGLTEGMVVAASPVHYTNVELRRSRCTDCERLVRVNDSADKFWPWIADDDSTICDGQAKPWGHRVYNDVSAWLKGETN